MQFVAGIYIHIPFCRKACNYCNFHFSTSLKVVDQMVNAIATELKLRSLELGNSPIDTIYFGGGTPSLLSENHLDQIFNAIESNFNLRDIQEITLEANPEDITTESLQTWKKFKIDRLSIGVQSLNEAELTFMNRNHNATQSKAAIELALNADFKNITIDLIYGSPWKTDEDWKSELTWALNAGITHLSAYALTVEPKTQLANQISKNILPSPTDERMESQFNVLQEYISKNGWDAYEISNYCKPGHRAIHNSNYWAGKPYLGVGPSAHSFDGQNNRRCNVSNNAMYMNGVESETVYWENEELTIENKFNEYLMTKLRTAEGIDLNYVNSINSTWKSDNNKTIEKLIRNENIAMNDNGLYLTNSGKLISDYIISLLMV